jgi:hypothetical protein
MKKKLVASSQGHQIKFSRDIENRGSTTMVNLEHSHDPMKRHSIALSMSRKTSQSLGNAEGIVMASIVACTAPGPFFLSRGDLGCPSLGGLQRLWSAR